MAKKIKVIVLHTYYGCDTGCCGHSVVLADDTYDDFGFEFEHPYGDDAKQWAKEFAQRAVKARYGKDHIADLDWDNCVIDC